MSSIPSSPLPGSLGGPEQVRPRPTPRHRKKSAQQSRAVYPRRRALAACEICRKRKSKCDNTRPVCGRCQAINAHCVYRNNAFDHSTYDLPSLEILDRVNYIAELLERQDRTLSPLAAGLVGIQQHVSPESLRFTENEAANYECQNYDMILSESLEFAGSISGTCEDVLEWPILEGRFHRADTEQLIFNPNPVSSTSFAGRFQCIESSSFPQAAPGRGVQEGDAFALIHRFLANVHIKNPILDVEELKRMAKDVMENGYRWDGTSCIVLIACALACLSSPYTSEFITLPRDGEILRTSADDVYDYPTAESYYAAAQKRISLLETSTLSAQCSFFSGVYEMYSLRPVRAWTSFNRACITIQLYLRAKPKNETAAARRLERRLYWSCLKSECEIRTEICLPPSGLAKVNYPDAFPTPPRASPQPGEGLPTGGTDFLPEASMTTLDPNLENSWGYYLSDIAVRRIGNRLINSFYKEEESAWLSIPVDRLIRVAEELDAQLTQWYNHLPSPVATPELSDTPNATEELQALLHARLLEFRERIHRPFLYLAIHLPATNPVQAMIEPYARRCLDACLEQAIRGSHRHRHHGSWYQNRKIFVQCLLVLGAVKSQNVVVPGCWREAVGTCIIGLQFWENEAPDLGKAALILQSLLEEVAHGETCG